MKVKKREVLVLYSADRSDAYSWTLWKDVERAFEDEDFTVAPREFVPVSARVGAFSGTPGAHSVGQDVCRDKEQMVFFAGRSEDFEEILRAVDQSCGSSEPFVLGGDDVARLGADVERRSYFHRLKYEFLDFTPNTASCEGSGNLYSTMKELFQEECPSVATTYLDGHATLAFDAVSVYLAAISYLQENARGMRLTPHAVWQALGTVHGDRALDGESGVVDFGGEAGGHTPIDKLISIQRVEQGGLPVQKGFCGRLPGGSPASWCP